MGEYAEAMLDGTLCSMCGTLLGGEAWGFPRQCRECREEEKREARRPRVMRHKAKKADVPDTPPRPCSCPVCAVNFYSRKEMLRHMGAAHRGAPKPSAADTPPPNPEKPYA